jgi:RNA ligase (TIGR02306 family)
VKLKLYNTDKIIALNEGEDLTELLGIQKYIKELPANLSGENEGEFPGHLCPRTDEDNGLNDPNLVAEVLNSSNDLVATMKIDGSSITIVVESGEIKQVCSRNLSKKETDKSTFWNAAKKLNIPENWTGVIQGELAGNGIQKNPLKLNGIEIFVFQVMEGGKYMGYDAMVDFCQNYLKCKFVPLVLRLDVDNTVKLWENPLKKLQEVADSLKYDSGIVAEGLVVRPASYQRSKSSRRPLGFKLINRNYKD